MAQSPLIPKSRRRVAEAGSLAGVAPRARPTAAAALLVALVLALPFAGLAILQWLF